MCLRKWRLYAQNGRLVMASLAKSMTSVLVAILLAQGKIRNQTSSSFSNGYGWHTTLGMVFPEAVNTPYHNVTLAALSSMYGGVPIQPNTTEQYWNFYFPDVPLMTQRANLTSYAFLKQPPANIPNTTYLYSNWG